MMDDVGFYSSFSTPNSSPYGGGINMGGLARTPPTSTEAGSPYLVTNDPGLRMGYSGAAQDAKPIMFRGPIGLRDTIVQQSMNRLGGTGSPYAPEMMSTADALMAMMGRAGTSRFGGGPSLGATRAEMGGLQYPAMSNLYMSDIGRRNALLSALTGASGLGGQLFGTQAQLESQARNIDTSAQEQESGLWKQVPIIGGILGGAL